MPNIKKYERKAEIVDAVQLSDLDPSEWRDWGLILYPNEINPRLDNGQIVCNDDWITKDAAGIVMSCTPPIFDRLYMEASAATPGPGMSK